MSPKPLQVRGIVTSRVVAAGSKSEHQAVTLDTAEGQSYVLRRKGGPAFGDEALHQLVGHRIAADGMGMDQTLIMQGWQVED